MFALDPSLIKDFESRRESWTIIELGYWTLPLLLSYFYHSGGTC